MLQLPHVDMDVIKKLSRKKVRGLGELLDMPEQERLSILQDTGQPLCANWLHLGNAWQAGWEIPVLLPETECRRQEANRKFSLRPGRLLQSDKTVTMACYAF